MRVLYFGTYERGYPRNAQVISCLRRAGVEVIERHAGVWEGRRESWRAGAGTVLRLAAAELRLLRRPTQLFDAVIVGYPGHLDLPAARRAARGRPVVFNPLVSLVDTFVGDRRRFRSGSITARALAAIDRSALRAADLVVADTRANAAYLARLAGLPREKLEICFVGAEERVFRPGWSPQEPFTCLFVGKLIPLHGLETILAAARAAPALRFRVVGSGQLEPLLHDRPANVDWLPWVDYERLPEELHRAGCALGIFGTSDKAARVIPNKAFQALACGTPLVTADTEAARELLSDGESALLVPAGDPAALSTALTRLAGDPQLRRRLSVGGLAAYREQASEEVLAHRWHVLLERLIDSR
ncbi:MAG TPA: glycosyltransferase [Gaiellaceae bacterium]|jgi:glycosyltransferase involved in cell wall biosynthesis|nr:glycosyltransferase [Gaiellaceae bacterium]